MKWGKGFRFQGEQLKRAAKRGC